MTTRPTHIPPGSGRRPAAAGDGAPGTGTAGTLAEGMRLHRGGRLQQAEAMYRRTLDADPDHAEALHLLGVVAHQQGRHAAAADLIAKAVVRDPNHAKAHANLGVALAAGGKLDAAVAAYRKAIALDPDHAAAHFNLGVALAHLGKLDEAVAAYREAVAVDPGYAEAHANLGAVLKDQGKLDEAVACCRQAVACDPKLAGAYYNLGLALKAQDKLDEAIAAYREAIALAPDYTEAHTNLGVVLRKHGALYRSAIVVDPWHEKANISLARALVERGDPGAALEAVDEVLKHSPGSTQFLSIKALVLDELGERDSARFLVDFARFVRTATFKTVAGFDSLTDFNAALARHVCSHPSLEFAPSEHATRFGQHSGNLLVEPKGPIGVLEKMIRGEIEDYMRTLPKDPSHPFLAEQPRRWLLKVWAVIMERQGHQIPHIHPTGWLSGVYYVKLPSVVRALEQEQAGWIEFGSPGSDFACTVKPELRLLKPEEGLIVLFPSYIYHRTVPFETDEERISIAFDVVPEDVKRQR